MVKLADHIGLDQTVTVGLICAEQKLAPRAELKSAIEDYVEAHYIRADQVGSPEDIPVTVLEKLHDIFGFDFEAHGGKLSVHLRA